ncbi:MAG TPA: AsmA family protein [Verrucomicrobiae bacterium]|jgi:uncharacterized protein involved in outer membrane biogenesis|nr:AsmA family protein [Verrucomicrobiae bacterium]
MIRPIRWLLRIAAALFLLAVIAVVAGIMLLDTFVRSIMVKGLHTSTGMNVRIASVHVGLRQPVIEIEGLKLYNTAEFGGKLCLDMPELHLEYDPAALRTGTYRFPLVRLNLAEIDVVTDKKGRSNFDAIAKQSKEAKSGTNTLSGIKFAGIDNLDLTLGKLHVSNLKSGQDEEVSFGIKNQIFHNVKSEADITGVALLMAMRGSSSGGHSGLDLNQVLKNLTAH